MRYLQRALDLADARGYLRYPEALALRSQVPEWFRALGTDAGAAEFAARFEFQLPAAMRELYACKPLACVVEALMIDSQLFLDDLRIHNAPPIVNWSAKPHLVFAFHPHSGQVFAAQLGADDPLTFCGYDGNPQPILREEYPPEVFSAWVYGAVDRYEVELDEWQKVYEDCQANPAEAKRQGGTEWIRHMPGMADRLK